MSDIVIKVENLSKQYRLGLVGTGTLAHDLDRWWHLVRGKEAPIVLGVAVNSSLKSKISNLIPEVCSFRALKDMDFEVKRGEVLGTIGRNVVDNRKISLTIKAAQGSFVPSDVFAPRWISLMASGGVIYFQESCHAS